MFGIICGGVVLIVLVGIGMIDYRLNKLVSLVSQLVKMNEELVESTGRSDVAG